MTLIKSVQAVIVNEDNQVLIIKRRGYNEKKFLWRLVKGRKNSGENDKKALKREIEEETGLKNFKILDKIHSYSFFTPENHRVEVRTYLVFASKNQKLEKKDQLEEISEYRWSNFDEAKRLLCFTEEKAAIEKAEKQLNHSPFS
ncbi:MAG: NUDIX hydrolase [Candidatus Aenigmarchaeota archaeon]|nr:NUDIX hydrolase [Candidatus Aenigmarchaeota archaeon]